MVPIKTFHQHGRYCIQHSRFTKQDGYELYDLSLSLNGNIAVTGCNVNTKRTYMDVYTSVRHSDSRDKPKIIYSKEFEKYVSEGMIYWIRLISFYPGSDTTVLSCLRDKLEVIDLIQDRVIKSRKIKLVKHGDGITCLSVRETEIFIGFWQSNKITVYDVIDLTEIKSIILQGIQDGYWPYDMTAIADRIFVCVGDAKEGSNNKSLIFEEKNGRILSELTKPTDTVHWYVSSVGVNMNTLGIAAVVWYDSYYYKERDHDTVVFYSLLSENNCSFLIVEVESGVYRIRISDRGDRMITGNSRTGEVKVYDMAEVFTYSHYKDKMASTLQTDECTKLANFFKIPKDQTDAILSSDKPSENLLHALEEKGILQPYNVERLRNAFVDLAIYTFCLYLTDIYQKTRAQSTSYGRFLATLSAHLTQAIPADLCNFFSISDEKKSKIVSSQNPGISLLLSLDEMGVIKVSEVDALEKPFTKMQMVQAVAKVHEYQSIFEEAENLLQKQEHLTQEGKKALFIQCLKKKIKSWYETMTPVPWKKSCRWKSTELFIGTTLILGDKKAKGTLASGDFGLTMQYTGIFSHEKLKSEIRIILEGDPGSGKTMLMSQLAYDWCQEKFKDIEVLVLLPLKFVDQKSIGQAIKDFYFPEDERLSVSEIEDFLLNRTISRCLLLDGLEEYNDGTLEREQSEVTQIMKKLKYPTCKIVISSRSDYAHNLPECPTLKLVKFSDNERNSYIQKVFPNNPKKQIEVKKVIKDNPFILDLCSIPLLFVLVVHNIESFLKLRIGTLDRVAPFVKNMVDTLCSVGGFIGFEETKETWLGELAYNGLCRGHQQLFWQKDFIEATITNSREWIDAGVLVVEEGSGPVSMVKLDEEQFRTTSAAGQDSKEQGRYPTVEGPGTIDKPPSDVSVESKSALPLNRGSDKDSEVKTEAGDSTLQSKTTLTGGSTAKHVPLQVRFLHKIIQEWFAANHFAYSISRYRDISHLERYINEQLLLIDPFDLHFVLRFTVALNPACCHLIIKYLLRNYRSKEGSIPTHIMDCIFLCFAEYDGKSRPSILETVAEVCKEEMVILHEDSRLLQQAKLRMMELASKSGILIKKVSLSDVVVSAADDALDFACGIMMEVLDTLEMIEIIDHDGILMEEDYTSLLKFIENGSLIKEARLYFPNEPPPVNEETAAHLQEDEKIVTWIGGSQHSQTLNTTTGEWIDRSDMDSLVSDEEAGFRWNEGTILETKSTVSSSGGVIEIPNTGVKLYIPEGALKEGLDQCSISMKIIPPDVTDKAITEFDFTRNSSVIVELLPDNLTFHHPVELTIPHCLQLVKGAEYKASIFISHHKEGTKPLWEEKAEHKHHLTDSFCTILLDSFSWVKYYVDSRIVDAKRIQVYAAGKQICYADSSYETIVGYYPAVPGGGQIFRSNERLVIASKKTFLFYKKGKLPLQISLQKSVPKEWKHLQVEESPKEIPFERIVVDKEWSRAFVFWKTSQEPLIPIFIFRVQQGTRGVRLLDRPEVWNKSLYDENNAAASVSTQSEEFPQETLPEVTWILGPEQRQTRDTTTGRWLFGNENQSAEPSHGTFSIHDFQVLLGTKVTVTKSGGVVEIPNTGVTLTIPPGALPEYMEHCEICLRIISGGIAKEEVKSFSSNAATVVELLPDSLKFQCPVRLALPHCLVLQETGERRARIFISHHGKGSVPQWEEQTHLSYHLEDTACIILLDSLCWIKISIDDEIVEAKKLVMYTAARKFKITDDVAEVYIGYYLDLPGQRKVIEDTQGLIIAHRKPFYFVKTKENYPLILSLDNIFPSGWQCQSKKPYLKKVQPNVIEDYRYLSCMFHIKRKTRGASTPLCLFTVSQKERQIAVHLVIHLKVVTFVESAIEVKNEELLPGAAWNPIVEDEASSNAQMTIMEEGGTLEIPGTGVFLKIPQNALPAETYPCVVHMRITSSRIVEDQVKSLCSNSATAVEIFPCNITLLRTAELILPHCLKLRKERERKARIFTNLEKGSPSFWEEQPDMKYQLKEDTCIISLKQLCCVKFSIDDSIVEAKKIVVYTATTAMTVTQMDELAEVEVGYYSDNPGGGELLRLNPNLKVDSKRTILLMEEQRYPLQVSLESILPLPQQWACSVPIEKPQEIPFNVIASSIEHSHLYILEKVSDQPGKVFCHFTATQEGNPIEMELSLTLPAQQKEQHKSTKQTDQQMATAESMRVTFQYLSKKLIGTEWKSVGRILGLGDADIDHIRHDNSGIQERIYEMLVIWQRKNASEATHAKLIWCLEQAERKDLAEDIKNRKDQEGFLGSQSGKRI